MKLLLTVASVVFAAGAAGAQKPVLSPPRTASGNIGNAAITVKYNAPSVRGRKIFGPGGRVSQDKTAPIWRGGANAATAFQTSADLDIGGLTVPKGNYTLFVDVKDPDAWLLIINKQTGQWGLSYDSTKDLGRVKMKMSTPQELIETLDYKIHNDGHNKGSLTLEWEHHIASVPIAVLGQGDVPVAP